VGTAKIPWFARWLASAGHGYLFAQVTSQDFFLQRLTAAYFLSQETKWVKKWGVVASVGWQISVC
jgi:hypothetical protein